MTRSKAATLAGAVLMLALLAWPGGAQAMIIERVSVAADGAQGDQGSGISLHQRRRPLRGF